MTDTKQPEALRLADWCEKHSSGIYRPSADAAAELRRLHAENTTLQQGYDAARLEIEALRLRECLHQIAEPAQSGRTADELGESQRQAAIAAYRAAHGHGPDFGFAPDRAWIEGAAYVDADRAMRAQAAPAAVAGPDRQALIDVIAQGLSDTWHCLRVWEAWNVGTMSQDDFEPVDESDTPAELADAILALLAAAPTTQAAPQQEPIGFFRAEPFGWTDCAPTDDGAIALYAAPQPAPVAQGDADPLQGAAQWLLEALEGCNIADLQSRLFIGFNRAERLMLAALAARSQAKEGASHE